MYIHVPNHGMKAVCGESVLHRPWFPAILPDYSIFSLRVVARTIQNETVLHFFAMDFLQG